MSKDLKCENPCKTCPFLRANFGKPNPDGYDPKEAAANSNSQNFYDWYSEKNLVRIWRDGITKGEVLMCHASDPNAETYGGKAGKKARSESVSARSRLLFVISKQLRAISTRDFRCLRR